MRITEAVVVLGVASWRIWRLVARDEIFALLRDRLSGWLAYMVGCPWCLGTWVAVIVTVTASIVADVPAPWLVGPGAAAVVGLLEVVVAHFAEDD